MPGMLSYSMEYLVDSKTRQAQRANTSLVESTEFPDLNNSEVFKTQAVHFGSGFKTDNSILWTLPESHLVITDPYNFIASFSNTEHGRNSWLALETHMPEKILKQE